MNSEAISILQAHVPLVLMAVIHKLPVELNTA